MDFSSYRRAAPSFRRINPDAADTDRAASALETWARPVIEAQFARDATETFDPALMKTESPRFGPFGSQERFERHVSERLLAHQATSSSVMDLRFTLGDQLQTMPYDAEWSTGAATGFQRFDGDLLTFGAEGFSACGIGIFLETEAAGMASVMPVGTWNFDVASLDNYPTLRSQGGMGMVVYESGTAQPLRHNHAVLWALNGGTHMGQGLHGNGRISDITVASAPFGPVPFAPLYFNVQANRRYEVWVWVWQQASLPPHAAFLAFLTAKIGLMAASIAPPIPLH